MRITSFQSNRTCRLFDSRIPKFGKLSKLTFCLFSLLICGQKLSIATEFAYSRVGSLAERSTSDIAALSVSVSPEKAAVAPASSIILSATVSGGEPASFQWQKGGVNLPSETSDTLTLSNFSAGDIGGYTAVVTFGGGTVLNDSAEVDIDTDEDGLPDGYETTTFGDLTTSAGSTHSDADGVSDLEEWEDGTNPLDASDYRPRLMLDAVGGIIYPDPDFSSFTLGQSISLTAEPFEGFGFYGWAGDISSVSPVSSINVTVDGSATVSANFNRHGILFWGESDTGEGSIPYALSNVLQVAGGETYVIALKDDGDVVGWGNNINGQLNAPAALDAVAISAGDWHAIALKDDGTVSVWGTTGNDLQTIPGNAVDLAAVSAGDTHNAVLREDGTVVTWGNNSYGQIDIPVGLNTVIDVQGGRRHTVALRADGTLYAWGTNDLGEIDVPEGEDDVVEIAVGAHHTVALRSDGTIFAFGENTSGQSTVPEGLTNVVEIGAGDYFSMAKTADGSIYAWGWNNYGQIDGFSNLPELTQFTGGFRFGLALADLDPSTNLPVILGLPKILGATDTGLYHKVRARNNPTSFGAIGLPSGLSINPTTGVISGSVASSGTFPVTLQVSNASGTVTKDVAIIINPPVPLITSPLLLTGYSGNSFSQQATGVHNPTFGASGLPLGLSIDPITGLITGTPLQVGSFDITLSTTNPYGSDSETVTVEIRDVFAWGNNLNDQSTAPLDMSGVIAVEGGDYHSLALLKDGTVRAWGFNGNDQTDVPIGLTDVVEIAAGERHSLALKSDGTVIAWGYDNRDQATVPAGLVDVAAIAAGYRHSVALKKDGTVVAWGDNSYGQTDVPVDLNGVVAIAAGERHTLALKSDGSIVGWGYNNNGETDAPEGLSGVVEIFAGDYHNIALLDDGSVVTWGWNGFGQTDVPAGLSDVVAVSAGYQHSLALKSDGAVVAWGGGDYEQFTVPAGLGPVAGIGCGSWHNLLIPAADPTEATPVLLNRSCMVVGKGYPFQKQLLQRNALTSYSMSGLPSGVSYNASTGLISGTPTTAGTYPLTVSVTNGSGTTIEALELVVHTALPIFSSANTVQAFLGTELNFQVAASNDPTFAATGLPTGLHLYEDSGLISGRPYTAGQYNVDLTATGTDGQTNQTLTIDVVNVLAWGNNGDGQANTPSGLNDAIAVSAGYYHTIALKSDGTVLGWGYGGEGQTTIPAGLSGVAAISAGERHNLALKSDKTVVAWGYNNNGQSTVPTGLTDVVAVSAGYRHSLALKSDGSVVAWGWNQYGQTDVPAGLTNVISVSAGERHSMALKSDGTIVGWGDDQYGQSTDSSALTNAIAIAAGDYFGVALLADGTAVAWGSNAENQATLPVGLTGVVSIAADRSGGYALTGDGEIVPWGDNSFSQRNLPLGLGSVALVQSQGYHVATVLDDPESLATQLAAWANGYGLSGPDTIATSDSDQDGNNLILEFAFNMLPDQRDNIVLTPNTGTSGMPYFSMEPDVSSDHLQVEFVRRKNAQNLAYVVEFTSDLGTDSWETVTPEIVNVSDVDDDWERVIVRDPKGTPPETKRFGRVRLIYGP